MKKLFALLTAVLLLLSVSCTGLAYDGEITFQGISWGASPQDTIQVLMNEKGIVEDSNFVQRLEQSKILEEALPFIWPESDNDLRSALFTRDHYENSDIASAVRIDGWSIKQTVGGYEPSHMILTYLNGDNDSQDYSFSSVMLWMFADSVDLGTRNERKKMQDDIVADLLEKLTAAYGEPAKYNDADYVWDGDNDTKLALIPEKNGWNDVFLLYGKASDYVAALEKAASLQASPTAAPAKVDSGL